MKLKEYNEICLKKEFKCVWCDSINTQRIVKYEEKDGKYVCNKCGKTFFVIDKFPQKTKMFG